MNTNTVETLRAELRSLSTQDEAQCAELARLAEQAAAVTADAGATADLQQARRSIFASLFRSGRPAKDAAPELATLDKQAQAAQLRAANARAATDAQRELEADIEAKRATIRARVDELAQALRRAEFEAALAEFETLHGPQCVEALIALKRALGKVYGALLARDRMHIRAGAGLRYSDGALMHEPAAALRSLTLSLPGIELEERLRGQSDLVGGNFGHARMDFSAEIESEAVALFERWTADTTVQASSAGATGGHHG